MKYPLRVMKKILSLEAWRVKGRGNDANKLVNSMNSICFVGNIPIVKGGCKLGWGHHLVVSNNSNVRQKRGFDIVIRIRGIRVIERTYINI